MQIHEIILLQQGWCKLQLIKFCNPEHNIRSGAGLRLGTLYKYRHIENSELQDGEEGSFSFKVNFPEKIELDRRWVNLLFKGFIHFDNGKPDDTPSFPGSMEVNVETFNIIEQKANSVVICNTSISIQRSVPNCLIFCMSAMEIGKDNPFKSYTDFWSFPIEKANQFATRIGELILFQTSLNTFEPSLINDHSANSIKRLALNVRHQKVLYRDRILNITKDNMITFDELVKILGNIPFLKPTSFEKECEYRFVFELTDGAKNFSPIEEDIDIELSALAEILA